MELNEALLKIKNHSTKKEIEKQTEEEKKYNEFIFLKNKILSFCDKLVELHEILNALAENKIENGKFFTNGIDHIVGFYGTLVIRRGMYRWDKENTIAPNGLFGIEGGGCDGGDLVVDIFNKTLKYTYTGKELEFNCISKMKKIVKEFDSFYKSVYEYVNNLN